MIRIPSAHTRGLKRYCRVRIPKREMGSPRRDMLSGRTGNGALARWRHTGFSESRLCQPYSFMRGRSSSRARRWELLHSKIASPGPLAFFALSEFLNSQDYSIIIISGRALEPENRRARNYGHKHDDMWNVSFNELFSLHQRRR